MALINVGSLGDFSVQALERLPNAEEIDTFSVLAEVKERVPANSFNFLTSPDRRGLALQSLQLKREFQNFFARLFHKKSNIYFLSWAYDVKGLSHYPGNSAAPTSCLIPLRGGELREFSIGAGVILFPPRNVAAGLALRIQIWEFRKGLRHFGEVMKEIASAIEASKLNTVLISLAAAPATGGASAALPIVVSAAEKLAQAVGDILKGSSDNFVDYFEGYYPAAGRWSAGEEQHEGPGTAIILNRLA